MSAKTMAEVLAEHSDYLWRTATGWECVCGHVISFTAAGALVSFTTHQAEMLSVAGFGLVADAGAKALEDAADRMAEIAKVNRAADLWQVVNGLRGDAAAVRGEG